jgi:hypothetical protein
MPSCIPCRAVVCLRLGITVFAVVSLPTTDMLRAVLCFRFRCAVLCCAVPPRLYEEVEPARVLDERAAATGSGKEYLVQYKVRRGFVCCFRTCYQGGGHMRMHICWEWYQKRDPSVVGGWGAHIPGVACCLHDQLSSGVMCMCPACLGSLSRGLLSFGPSPPHPHPATYVPVCACKCRTTHQTSGCRTALSHQT